MITAKENNLVSLPENVSKELKEERLDRIYMKKKDERMEIEAIKMVLGGVGLSC